MVLEPVLCPTCGENDVVKHGRSGEGKQRYKCRALDWALVPVDGGLGQSSERGLGGITDTE